MRDLMLAVLCPSYTAGAEWVRQQGPAVLMFNRVSMFGTILLHGAQRRFSLVTTEEQLRGLELLGFEVAAPVPLMLVETARTRIR